MNTLYYGDNAVGKHFSEHSNPEYSAEKAERTGDLSKPGTNLPQVYRGES